MDHDSDKKVLFALYKALGEELKGFDFEPGSHPVHTSLLVNVEGSVKRLANVRAFSFRLDWNLLLASVVHTLRIPKGDVETAIAKAISNQAKNVEPSKALLEKKKVVNAAMDSSMAALKAMAEDLGLNSPKKGSSSASVQVQMREVIAPSELEEAEIVELKNREQKQAGTAGA